MTIKTDWIFSEADHSLHQEFSDQDSIVNPIDNANPAEAFIDHYKYSKIRSNVNKH